MCYCRGTLGPWYFMAGLYPKVSYQPCIMYLLAPRSSLEGNYVFNRTDLLWIFLVIITIDLFSGRINAKALINVSVLITSRPSSRGFDFEPTSFRKIDSMFVTYTMLVQVLLIVKNRTSGKSHLNSYTEDMWWNSVYIRCIVIRILLLSLCRG